MNELERLRQHRDNILRAEIAGWLHNLGKLSPNFLVQQTAESPDIIGIYRTAGQYSFRRFTEPSILRSDFPFRYRIGPLYFVDLNKRQAIKSIKERIEEIKRSIQTASNPAQLGQELQRLDQQSSQAQKDLESNEQKRWKTYEQEIEAQSFTFTLPFNWPLGSLLTLFWEGEWFEKPDVDIYEPGTSGDPDYQRRPQSHIALQNGLSMDMPMLLLLAHGEVSGQEKKGFDFESRYIEVEDYQNPDSALSKLRLATAFGYETPLNWEQWPEQRQRIIDQLASVWAAPAQYRDNFLRVIQHLSKALADTQRPINEISLLDYSQATAALFKTAVVQFLFSKQVPTPSDMRWRLVALRLDAFDFLFQVNALADLIARRELLQKLWGSFCHRLEIQMPIGSVIYADEHGLVFVLPGLPDQDNESFQELLDRQIDATLAKQNDQDRLGLSDLHPTLYVGRPQRGKKLSLPDILSEKEPSNIHNPDTIRNYWLNQSQDLCSNCQLRPIGYVEPRLPHFVTKEKAKERNLCGICLARRGRRAQRWAEKEGRETIWIDEVADLNGRLALITGKFDVDDWLNGTLVRSLAIGTDKNDAWLAKPPTFARIQRVWRTTHQFWQNVQEGLNVKLTDDRRRLILWLDQQPDMGHYHAYELEIGENTLSVVWYPPKDDQQGHFISTDNLGYTARQLGAEKEVYSSPAAAAIFVEDYIQKQLVDGSQSLVLRNPEATGAGQISLTADRSIIRLQHQETVYSSTIPILAEPRTFMALVPAKAALDVIQTIRKKYEREMGKVRNRLPLHLGAVYFHRRTPLRAALDAGRRMLTLVPAEDAAWTVTGARDRGCQEAPEHLRDAQFGRWREVILQRGPRRVTWRVPLCMGDGTTEDVWYPYAFLETGVEPLDRDRRFRAPKHRSEDGGWLVHVGELKKGDIITFTPATFDFEYLDTTARRFEVSYTHGRRRGPAKTQRPYRLDDLVHIQEMWETLKGALSTSQIKALETLIETRRGEWEKPKGDAALGLPDDDPFRQLCRDALANAGWRDQTWATLAEEKKERLRHAALSGLLADALELHLTIAREEDLGREQENQKKNNENEEAT